jgi:hypothetical protein
MIETAIRPTVSVSPEEVRVYYDANPSRFTDPERVHVRQVFLQVGPDTTEGQKAEMRRTLEGLRSRALKGESFAKLADQYSQDPNSGEGGDMGYLIRGQLAKDFEKTVFALKDGEISGVVSSIYGYHLVQAIQHQAPSQVSFERVKESLTGFLVRRKLDQTVSAPLAELREKAKISIPQSAIAGALFHPLAGPLLHAAQRRLQGPALLGEGVADAHRRAGFHRACHQALGLQLLHARGQHTRAQGVDGLLHFAEMPGAAGQNVHDQPPIFPSRRGPPS